MSAKRHPRILLAAAIVAVALLCTFSAGNRLAGLPGHAESRLSPSWFGSGNAQQRALSAIDRGDFVDALRWSSIVLARDPVGQHSASLFALSLLGTGQATAAQQAYTVAATGGWRDAGVQTYWMMAALGVNDANVAAERLDALLRTGNRDPQTFAGLQAMESTPARRQALVERLRLSPDWAQWYLGSLSDLHGDDLAARLTVIGAAFERGLHLDRRSVAIAAAKLQHHREIEAAAWLWRRIGGGKNVGLTVADGNFDNSATGAPASPFDWTLMESGAVDTRIVGDSPLHSGPALYTLSSATVTRRVAQQALVLPPGVYALRWRSVDSTSNPSSDIIVRVFCDGPTSDVRESEARPGTRKESIATFVIPAVGCRSQIIAIEIRPNTGMTRAPTWTDDVSIVRLPNGN